MFASGDIESSDMRSPLSLRERCKKQLADAHGEIAQLKGLSADAASEMAADEDVPDPSGALDFGAGGSANESFNSIGEEMSQELCS